MVLRPLTPLTLDLSLLPRFAPAEFSAGAAKADITPETWLGTNTLEKGASEKIVNELQQLLAETLP